LGSSYFGLEASTHRKGLAQILCRGICQPKFAWLGMRSTLSSMRASLTTRSVQHLRCQGRFVGMARVPGRTQAPAMVAPVRTGTLRLTGQTTLAAPLRQQRYGSAQGAEEPKPEGKREECDSKGGDGSGGSGGSSSSADTSAGDSAKAGGAEEKGAATAEASVTDTTPAGEESPSTEEEKESPLELLEKELAEAQEKITKERHELLLALAEFENNKKRNQTECQRRRRAASVNFATKMVEVYGKFDELTHSEDKAEDVTESCKALLEGVVLTRDLYKATLDKFDVEQLQVQLGEPFNQTRHDKLGSVEDASVAADSVAEVVRPGWVLEAKSAKPVVLRKAEVKVAAHGPATPPPPP